jgi:4-hydroxy-tetrahydrodipicolinate synthase
VNPVAIYELYQKCSGVCAKRRANAKALGTSASTSELESLQARLNVVRDVFSSRKFPSMIAAIKQAIAIYANDPEWARVRPPLVELTTEQTKSLAEQLAAIGFAMTGMERAGRAT